MADRFHDFVVVVATKEPLSLSDDLTDSRVVPIEPSSLSQTPTSLPRVPKRKRSLPQTKPSPSRLQQKKKMKNQPKLQVIDETPTTWKPHLTYFHFVLHRDAVTPAKQTFDFVQWALEFLYEKQLFSPFKNIKLWSDGCGKHFKCYNAQFYMSQFQEQLKVKLTWDFLAPSRAHNKADSAAAYLKGAIKRHVDNFYLLSRVTHLAFACSRLKNTFLIEADFEAFPEVENAAPMADIRFMRDAFSFQYQPQILQVMKCKHTCKKKCIHKCCKNPPTCWVSSVTVIQRNGTSSTFKLIGKETVENEELYPLEENGFWASLDRQTVTKPISEVRISQTRNNEDFNYDVSLDDPSYLSDDEYIDKQVCYPLQLLI
jgi:hypothetical protein